MRTNEQGRLQSSPPSASGPVQLKPALSIPAFSGNMRVGAERTGLNAAI